MTDRALQLAEALETFEYAVIYHTTTGLGRARLDSTREACLAALSQGAPEGRAVAPQAVSAANLNRCGCDHWAKPTCPERRCPWREWKRTNDSTPQASSNSGAEGQQAAPTLRDALLKCKTCDLPTEVREVVNAALRGQQAARSEAPAGWKLIGYVNDGAVRGMGTNEAKVLSRAKTASRNVPAYIASPPSAQPAEKPSDSQTLHIAFLNDGYSDQDAYIAGWRSAERAHGIKP
jgi:hypothetical protein